MKAFEAPCVDVVRFTQSDVVVCSCPTDCECVECLPCEHGNDCKWFDTCPTYCAKDK